MTRRDAYVDSLVGLYPCKVDAIDFKAATATVTILGASEPWGNFTPRVFKPGVQETLGLREVVPARAIRGRFRMIIGAYDWRAELER